MTDHKTAPKRGSLQNSLYTCIFISGQHYQVRLSVLCTAASSVVCEHTTWPVINLARQTHFRKREEGLLNCVYKPCPGALPSVPNHIAVFCHMIQYSTQTTRQILRQLLKEVVCRIACAHASLPPGSYYQVQLNECSFGLQLACLLLVNPQPGLSYTSLY